jgi:hypothetical protein
LVAPAVFLVALLVAPADAVALEAQLVALAVGLGVLLVPALAGDYEIDTA